MPNPSRNPDDREAREVDRLLRELGTPASKSDRPHPTPGARPPRAPTSPSTPPPRPVSLPSPGGVWARVGLGVVLAGALTQWPYETTCGLPLAAYLAAVAMALLTGVWAAHASWRRRIGPAHVLAILVVFGAVALAAHQTLPRLGYMSVGVAWRCPS